VRSILGEAHRLGSAGIDLGAPAFDFSVPRGDGVRFRLTIETSDQLERKPRAFFSRKLKDVGQDVRGSHRGQSSRRGRSTRRL
jgi:hypothetical protein